MRFQVPQFIEVEDKIFGPLTLRQFIYLVAGGSAVFMLWRFLPFFIGALFIIPVAAFSIALAFYKINNKPFIFTVEAAIKYMFGNKLYIWKKEVRATKKTAKTTEDTNPSVYLPKLSDSKLKDLTWILDVNQSQNSDGGGSIKS